MATSAFFNSTIVFLFFMPVLDSISLHSKGVITRKHTYLPLAIGSVLGSNLTIIGSTSMLNACGLFANSSGGHPIGFFEPALIALPSCIVTILIYMTFGYSFQKKCFDFPERSPQVKEGPASGTCHKTKGKMRVVLLVSGLCVIGFISGSFNLGAVALAGAMALVLTRCIDLRTALKNMNWETVFMVAGSIGFAKGIEVSGAGLLISETAIRFCGPLGESPFGMCVLIMLLSTILSNFLSNNAVIAMIVPISMMIADGMGFSALPFVIAIAVATNIDTSTPIGVTTITMTLSAGYRFKDYFRVGGLINLISILVTIPALYIVYFM